MTLGFSEYFNGVKTDFVRKIHEGSKIHSIRRDEKNRWRQGREINFVTGNRTPDRFEFKTGACISTQAIKIEGETVFIDGVKLENLNELAVNDGFESAGDFITYFNGNFEGKIIHWTEKRY